VEYADVANLLGLGGSTDEERVVRLIGAVEELKAKLDIPLTLREIIGAEREQEYMVGGFSVGRGRLPLSGPRRRPCGARGPPVGP
jgi:alcohol dehydrogenase class IV